MALSSATSKLPLHRNAAFAKVDIPWHAIGYHRVLDSRAQPFTQETIDQGIDRTRPRHDGSRLGKLGMVWATRKRKEDRK